MNIAKTNMHKGFLLQCFVFFLFQDAADSVYRLIVKPIVMVVSLSKDSRRNLLSDVFIESAAK